MRISAILFAAALSAGIAPAAERPGVYGTISDVVFEPNAPKPERVRIWGTFAIAAPGPAGSYQAPEEGYLYFALPADPHAALSEIDDLRHYARTPRVVAFGRPGVSLRVLTAEEKPERPAPYVPGPGVTPVDFEALPPAAQSLGRTLKMRGEASYALVDRVALEPNAEHPERIQIWGAFAAGQGIASYAAPRRGYLYLALPPDRLQAPYTLSQWSDWKSVAGTRQVVKFSTYYGSKLRIRAPEEKPDAPDSAQAAAGLVTAKPDPEYAPVRALLEFH
jgi:hypothetical protein